MVTNLNLNSELGPAFSVDVGVRTDGLSNNGTTIPRAFQTREDLVLWAQTANPVVGFLAFAEGYVYRYTGDSTEIIDLPGFVLADALSTAAHVVLAQAWAESDTAPGDPGTKSAKTHAEAAEAAAVNAAIGTPYGFETVAEMLANTSLAYVAAVGKVVVPPGRFILAGGFRYQVAASAAVDHHVSTAGGVKLKVLLGNDGFASIMAFGATGIAGQDQTAAMQAAAASALSISVPEGIYDHTTKLTLLRPWIGTRQGWGPTSSGCEFRFFGSGLAVDAVFSFENISIRSMAANQSGLRVAGAVGNRFGPSRIYDFDTIAVEIGNKGVSGSYFIDLSPIEIQNNNRDGLIGLRISGLSLPASNANYMQCPWVGGRFKRLFDIEGNANILMGGYGAPNNAAVSGGIDEMVRFGGIGNIWIAPYFEPVGATVPAVYFRFEAGARNNKVEHIYAPSLGPKTAAKIVDLGVGNQVDIRATGENFPQTVGLSYNTQNLLPNSHLRNLRADGMPQGWIKSVTGSATVTRDTTHLRGAPYALKLASSGDGRAMAQAMFATSNPGAYGALEVIPADRLRGRTMTVGVWCWSAVEDFGAIKIGSLASYGTAKHSGSGAWEFLAASTRMADAGVDFSIQLRSNSDNLNSAGECWFTEPIVVFGTDLPQVYEPRAITDAEAAMAGRIVTAAAVTFADGDTTPDVSEANFFVATNTAATTITAFDGKHIGGGAQEICIIATNGNTTIANNSTIRTKTGAATLLTAYSPVKFAWIGTLAKWVECG